MSDILGLILMIIVPLFFGIYASRKITQIGDQMFIAKEKPKDEKKDESDENDENKDEQKVEIKPTIVSNEFGLYPDDIAINVKSLEIDKLDVERILKRTVTRTRYIVQTEDDDKKPIKSLNH